MSLVQPQFRHFSNDDAGALPAEPASADDAPISERIPRPAVAPADADREVPLPLALLAVGDALVTGADEEQRFWRGLVSGSIAWERGQAADAIFRGLLAGRYALVDSVRTDSSAFLFVRGVPAWLRERHALSARQLARLRSTAVAERAKNTAMRDDISQAGLSGSVAAALRQIGFASREELMWFCRDQGALAAPPTLRVARLIAPRGELAVLVFPRGPSEVRGPFSSAERATVLRVLAGMSNLEIAVDRGVSICTVQNQVAAALRRAHVGSRFELIAQSSAWARSAPPPERLPPWVVRRFAEAAWSKKPARRRA